MGQFSRDSRHGGRSRRELPGDDRPLGADRTDRRRGASGAGRRISDWLRSRIADGTLAANTAVPSTRVLAADLGVSRTTVTAAYEQLAAEGFIVTSSGRVARVADLPSVSRPLPSPGADATPVTRATRRKRGQREAQEPQEPQEPQERWGPKRRRGNAETQVVPKLSAIGQRLARITLPPPAPLAADRSRIDFLYGALAWDDFPALAWRRAWQAELLNRQPRLAYLPPEGDAGLRQALQGYLRRARNLRCDPAQILIVNGSQQAIDLCARLLLDAGDGFVFEDPGYLMARCSFEATGARLLATPVDAQGLVTRALPRTSDARLAFVTPSHQFPLGGVLPIGRRRELLQWAQRHDAWIIEDDYDGEFRYGQYPIATLQSIDGDGRVIYVGTLSKALSPQLRFGYLVLPTALIEPFRNAKRLIDRHAPALEQRALSALIDSGAFERHVRRTRREHERRRAALLEAIATELPASVRIGGEAAGLHLVLWLPDRDPVDEATVVAAARDQGVGVYPLSPLYASTPGKRPDRPAGLVMGYASLAVESIHEGIRRLGRALAAPA